MTSDEHAKLQAIYGALPPSNSRTFASSMHRRTQILIFAGSVD